MTESSSTNPICFIPTKLTTGTVVRQSIWCSLRGMGCIVETWHRCNSPFSRPQNHKALLLSTKCGKSDQGMRRHSSECRCAGGRGVVARCSTSATKTPGQSNLLPLSQVQMHPADTIRVREEGVAGRRVTYIIMWFCTILTTAQMSPPLMLSPQHGSRYGSPGGSGELIVKKKGPNSFYNDTDDKSLDVGTRLGNPRGYAVGELECRMLRDGGLTVAARRNK
ncbi:hypothetical protein IWX90DRAFT_441735 [Phyllosticta citrichinensis]|uniref:Uncharacterized protein n=1 Tax=Phyllosticta citrichinensis TaxID=1130410 RepID=A0ABR1XJC6_9PEZI